MERWIAALPSGFATETLSGTNNRPGVRWEYRFDPHEVRITNKSTGRGFVLKPCATSGDAVLTVAPRKSPTPNAAPSKLEGATVRASVQKAIPGGVVTFNTRDEGGQVYSEDILSVRGLFLKLTETSLDHYILALDGTKIAETDGFPRFLGVYGDSTHAYVLVEEGSGGTACPVKYRVIELVGAVNFVTEPFGSCSDKPSVKLSDGGLIVDTPRFGSAKRETVRVYNGVITK